MEEMTRRRLLALPVSIPLSLGIPAGTLRPEANNRTTDSESEKQAQRARERVRRRYFPDVILTTHEGKSARFYEDLIKDKSVVLNMMYADCEGVCPGITANLVRVQTLLGDRVGRDIFFYSLTLKPERDDSTALKHYAEIHKVGPGWLFLTGKLADVELLRRKLGFTNPDPKLDADTSEHIGNIRFGNEPRTQWAACPGLAKPTWIVEELSWVMRPPANRSRA
ncbi:MAG TPA: SCO family protein [Blastocatellia bacterium]|nr:SCO family protein [Blastocatellia bacterium]